MLARYKIIFIKKIFFYYCNFDFSKGFTQDYYKVYEKKNNREKIILDLFFQKAVKHLVETSIVERYFFQQIVYGIEDQYSRSDGIFRENTEKSPFYLEQQINRQVCMLYKITII